ncbi:superoxide dismutase [Sulfurimonas sp. MAG313]|nr:Fe-Mn family superoxide dismutase [Sulfurimonas sp. MAG313]MDF1879986.1 superoxide dismutase [Sulfurimonas sp. MAG313]
MNRRKALIVGSVIASSALLQANTKTPIIIKPSYGSTHQIKPLSFNPKSLKGISEKVIVSHHDNNYAGAVKKLNLIQGQISSLPHSAHPIELGALKKEELIALNSKLLHELYFDNLGGKGVLPTSMKALLTQGFGSVDAWKNDFVKTGKSLGGGSGWVILSYIKEEQVLINQIAGDHSDSVATGIPLLVMDMYEHSYHMDYGVKAGKYIDAFMGNINWKEVSSRWEAI